MHMTLGVAVSCSLPVQSACLVGEQLAEQVSISVPGMYLGVGGQFGELVERPHGIALLRAKFSVCKGIACKCKGMASDV